jgi:hypothetical protein
MAIQSDLSGFAINDGAIWGGILADLTLERDQRWIRIHVAEAKKLEKGHFLTIRD